MERRFYKELWKLRFQKMLKLEKQSISDYQSLLKDLNKRFKNHVVAPHLETLVADEKKHALLVEQLLQILDSQPD